MKTLAIALSLTATAFFATNTLAEETVIKERTERTGPGISVGVPGVNVGIGAQERTSVTTETRRPVDCESKTVRKEDSTGSTTIRKENCD
jgi:hypothetical protein